LLPALTDFLEGEASKEVCQRISRHLVGCKKCRMYVDAHAGVIQLYKPWRGGAMPGGAKLRLKKRIEREIAAAAARQRW
jgi:predicted anti-sigma-YlaC factor YlaD